MNIYDYIAKEGIEKVNAILQNSIDDKISDITIDGKFSISRSELTEITKSLMMLDHFNTIEEVKAIVENNTMNASHYCKEKGGVYLRFNSYNELEVFKDGKFKVSNFGLYYLYNIKLLKKAIDNYNKIQQSKLSSESGLITNVVIPTLDLIVNAKNALYGSDIACADNYNPYTKTKLNLKFKEIKWSDEKSPDSSSSYSHMLGSHPLGEFKLEWKSWKENDYVDVSFNDMTINVSGYYSELSDIKQRCQNYINELIEYCIEQ